MNDTVVAPLDALHQLCLADAVWAERYQGWTELGRGGSASVVRTWSRATGEDVALKVFHHLLSEDEQRFRQEVRSAQRLTSPYVVRTYGAFPRGRLAWIEMELVEGPDLRRELERRTVEGTPFDVGTALGIATALTHALVAAHEAGVVHRDVKPGNVLLPASGKPVAKLGDFGLSRVAGSTRVTATGLLAGTPQFVAPEIVAGKAASPASDVYSLALTLYLVFSGNRSPFDIGPEASPAEWLRAHGDVRPRPLRERAPGAPQGIAQILAEGLSKDPSARPTAAHFASELRGLAAGAHTLGGLVSRPPSSRRTVLFTTAAAGLLLAVALAGARFRASDAATPSPTLPAPVVSSSPAPGAFRATLTGDMLTVFNAGATSVSDLNVTLSDATGAVCVATVGGALAPGEEVMLALDAFVPPPPPGWRPRLVRLKPKGAAHDVAVVP